MVFVVVVSISYCFFNVELLVSNKNKNIRIFDGLWDITGGKLNNQEDIFLFSMIM